MTAWLLDGCFPSSKQLQSELCGADPMPSSLIVSLERVKILHFTYMQSSSLSLAIITKICSFFFFF